MRAEPNAALHCRGTLRESRRGDAGVERGLRSDCIGETCLNRPGRDAASFGARRPTVSPCPTGAHPLAASFPRCACPLPTAGLCRAGRVRNVCLSPRLLPPSPLKRMSCAAYYAERVGENAPGRRQGPWPVAWPRWRRHSQQRLSKLHKMYGFVGKTWSERLDSNQRPLDPQSSALPDCATLRLARTIWAPARPRNAPIARSRAHKPAPPPSS